MRAILTFHSIDDSGSVLSFPAQLFAQLLEAISRAGVPVCDLEMLLLPEKQEGIVLTFDDGLRSVFTTALPILRDHAVPAHLFLTTGAVGGDNRWPSQRADAPRFAMMSWTEVEQLHDAGCRIEGHTVSHPDLRALTNEAALAECAEADAAIARRLGRAPRYFAYPYGALNTRIASLLRDRYRACLTTKLRPLRDDDDPAALGRLDSYYLRHRWLARDLRDPSIRGYITVRRWLRELRAPW